eukprot:3936593-Rhodomonas_salina.1
MPASQHKDLRRQRVRQSCKNGVVGGGHLLLGLLAQNAPSSITIQSSGSENVIPATPHLQYSLAGWLPPVGWATQAPKNSSKVDFAAGEGL